MTDEPSTSNESLTRALAHSTRVIDGVAIGLTLDLDAHNECLRQAHLLYNKLHPGMGWPDWDNLTDDIIAIYYDEVIAQTILRPGGGGKDSHDLRAARRQIKELNKINARQGRTICALRGDVARVREESHKIDRGDLRRLERDQATLLEELSKGLVVIGKLRERLREAKALEMPVTEAGIQHDG